MLKTTHKMGDNAFVNIILNQIFSDITERYFTLLQISPCLGEKEILVIQNSLDNPKCLITDLPRNYIIQITDYDSKNYCKIAFQFSHEIGHIICGPNVNNWLIETACEFISIDSLKYLSKKWRGQTLLLDENGNDFSPYFESYIDNTVLTSFEAFGMTEEKPALDILKCFIENSPPTYARDFNRIIAKRLFNQFSNNPKELIMLFSKLSNLSTHGEYQPSDFWEHTQPDFKRIEEIFFGFKHRILN